MTRRFENCQVLCRSRSELPESPTQPPARGGCPVIVMTCLSLMKAVICAPFVTTWSLFTLPTPLLIASLLVHPTGLSQRLVNEVADFKGAISVDT